MPLRAAPTPARKLRRLILFWESSAIFSVPFSTSVTSPIATSEMCVHMGNEEFGEVDWSQVELIPVGGGAGLMRSTILEEDLRGEGKHKGPFSHPGRGAASRAAKASRSGRRGEGSRISLPVGGYL